MPADRVANLRRRRGPAFAVIALAASVAGAAAQDAMRPRLHTNEAYVEEVSRPTTLDVTDPMAVLAFVFESLPERVKVYPTENYYYFNFFHEGVGYGGNIRLDASDRDAGKLHFAYFEDLAEWREETPVIYRQLDASHGVRVERLERLIYRVSYRGRSVTFALNDLSQAAPPPGAIGPDESYIGPIFDESAIRFFLVFNRKLKIFHYLLDETEKVSDQFLPLRGAERVLIGKRTGFAFYRDHLRARKILIGVFEGNTRVNNYFDGPFDQMPDNFIAGETLREAILMVEPSLKGKIDRFGGSPDGAERYMIDPYLTYGHEGELRPVHRCAVVNRGRPAAYYRCFHDIGRPAAARGGRRPAKPARPPDRR